MGSKIKGWHTKAPKNGSKVLRDAIISGPKAGPHKDKRQRRQQNPNRSDSDEWYDHEHWDRGDYPPHE